MTHVAIVSKLGIHPLMRNDRSEVEAPAFKGRKKMSDIGRKGHFPPVCTFSLQNAIFYQPYHMP